MRYLILLLVCLGTYAQSQTFEGKIVYRNSYISKIPQLSDAQFTTLMGDKQEYFIKGADYKSVLNGTYSQMQIYNHDENKIYHKLSLSDTLYWIDAGKENDPVVSHVVEKKKETILGYVCDVITIKTKDGSIAYYFNEKLGVDPLAFQNHHYMDFDFIMKHTKALPLKAITETKQFRMESVAIEIVPQKLEKSLFVIPPGTPTKVSPF